MESKIRFIHVPNAVATKIEGDINKALLGRTEEYITHKLREADTHSGSFKSFIIKRSKQLAVSEPYLHGALLIHDALLQTEKSGEEEPTEEISIHESDLVQQFMHKKPVIFKGSERFFSVLFEQSNKYVKAPISVCMFWIGVVEAVKELKPLE